MCNLKISSRSLISVASHPILFFFESHCHVNLCKSWICLQQIRCSCKLAEELLYFKEEKEVRGHLVWRRAERLRQLSECGSPPSPPHKWCSSLFPSLPVALSTFPQCPGVNRLCSLFSSKEILQLFLLPTLIGNIATYWLRAEQL